MNEKRFAWRYLPFWAKRKFEAWRISQAGRPGLGRDAYYWHLQDIGADVVVTPRNRGYRLRAVYEFKLRAPRMIVDHLRKGMR